jgi:hypothetical protein
MLVTVADLVDYMDITFTNRQKKAAGFVLEGLQSELEGWLRRPVEQATFTESYVLPNNFVGVPTASFFYDSSLDTTQRPISYVLPPNTVYFRNSPVASVATVTLTSPGGSVANLVQGTDFVVQRYGIDLYRGFANDRVDVTYTAGLDGPEIKIFKLLILRAATREMQNMHDDVVGVKDLETRNVAPLTTGFTQEELMSVKRWKRVRVA